MTAHPLYISKTKYMEGLRCPKLLWYDFNRKQDIPELSSQIKAVMEEGSNVGLAAQHLFPGGIKLSREWRPERMHAKSIKALERRKPLFEAGFLYGSAYAIADILVPAGEDFWDLIEVKSSSGVKEEYNHDVAFQKFTYGGAGLKIRGCYVMFLNRDYVKQGAIDFHRLFKKENITEKVDLFLPAIEKELASMSALIACGKAPAVKIGEQCGGCPLKPHCWSFLPTASHVFVFNRGNKVSFDLLNQGIVDIKDIPAEYELNESHAIQRKALLGGEEHVNRGALRAFFERIKYPLYFLDFETLAPAIPIYDQTSPYEEVPFQFSLYAQERENALPTGHSYLAAGAKDPRPEVLSKLRAMVGDEGSIFAYNAAYEIKCLKKAAAAVPEYMEWAREIESRFVDLWEPFKCFYYYHPKQEESTSMKSVLPVFSETTHKGMEISEGWTARNEYMRVTFGSNISDCDRGRVYSALKKYCELDTLGMVEIVKGLKTKLAAE